MCSGLELKGSDDFSATLPKHGVAFSNFLSRARTTTIFQLFATLQTITTTPSKSYSASFDIRELSYSFSLNLPFKHHSHHLGSFAQKAGNMSDFQPTHSGFHADTPIQSTELNGDGSATTGSSFANAKDSVFSSEVCFFESCHKQALTDATAVSQITRSQISTVGLTK